MRNSDDERPTEREIAVGNEHLTPGTEIGGYVIDGELGSGGMGVVYSAVHPVIGKRAAIKVLKPEMSKSPAAVERFVMEARAVNQIGHPNIVDIFAFGVLPDGRSYYVMDLLLGESLRRRISRGALHVTEAVAIIDETASALMAAHDKGIIHRDLKPDNVFMVSVPGRWPEVKILDWGLLKLTHAQSAVGNNKYRTLAGSVMGTPAYMSPEQARASDAIDFRADIYSLGVMSYELLTGSVPFKRGTSVDTMAAHAHEPVPPLGPQCPSLPVELVQLIEAMLAKPAADRPTLAAVRAVIKRLKGSKIPTMTAAGLSMPAAPATPFTEPPTNSTPTLDERALSMQVTSPRLPRRDPELESAEQLPPPPTQLPSQSNQSLPYAAMHISSQTTLAGHSVPLPPQPRFTPPRASTSPPTHGSQPLPVQPPSSQPPSQPQMQAYGSQPPPPQPPHTAYSPQPSPPQPSPPKATAKSSSAMRFVVIALAAITVATAGIVAVMMN